MIEMAEAKTSSGGNKQNFFTETVTIVKAKVHYNETQKWRKFPDDVGLTLTLDIGKDFQPEWYLGGSYKKDPVQGTITGWSTVWSGVGMIFRSVGTPIKCPEGQTVTSALFPEQLISNLEGKQICRLKYKSANRTDKNGNPKWVEFNNTEKAGNDEALMAKFAEDIKAGWVKDFLDPSKENTNPVQGEDHPLENKVNAMFQNDLPV